jgi:formylglycine-generating enzyme required for sulfatase activity
LVSFVDAADVGALVGVRARLTLTGDDGRHPIVTLQSPGADATAVEAVEVPLPCDAPACRGRVLVEPGRYDVTVTLSALDRCNGRGDVARFVGVAEVGHWQSVRAELTLAQTSFDVDSDGVIDLLEAAHCGRFDLDDGAVPPRQCAPGREACCPDASPLVGGHMRFSSASVQLPYDRDGIVGDDVVTVAAFAIDSTEFTYGALKRCVIAGACLAGRPGHPARRSLARGVDERLPVQGLTPAEAAEACAWLGKRLPRDAEWHAAASLRADGSTATYPFDVDEDAVIGCEPEDPPPAARYAAAGRSCGGGELLPVGSFSQTLVTRGEGTALADLAGNVAEWTVIGEPTSVDDDSDGIPDGASSVVLRGGGATSIAPLLENNLPILFDVAEPGDLDDLVLATELAGFRCASDDAAAPIVEPSCQVPND